jgi:Uma2 family endonuclease
MAAFIEMRYHSRMPALLENPEHKQPLSIEQVAAISQTLARDLSRLTLKSEGFTVEDYLSLDGPYLAEYIDGRIQVLPMPDLLHQALVFWLVSFLKIWAAKISGTKITFAPFKVFVRENQYREPDVCLMLPENVGRAHRSHWEGADLVIEIISESNRRHDVETKRIEYAANGIPEYWIVDPENHRVTVLKLVGTTYAVHGEFAPGDHLTSALLADVRLDVKAMFDEAEAQA